MGDGDALYSNFTVRRIASHGIGVEQNQHIGLDWMKKSADAGNELAKRMIPWR